MKNLNILIVGVGGQGTLLASRILGGLADYWGMECKLSEVHGMAQRGGSVVTHVKISNKVYSPIVEEGDADVILAFEILEALRYRHFLKKEGKLIYNTQTIMPLPVIIGDATYPENIEQILKKDNISYIAVDALAEANKLNNVKTVNTIMIGVFAKIFNINIEDIKKALEATVPKKILEINEKAIEQGYLIADGV